MHDRGYNYIIIRLTTQVPSQPYPVPWPEQTSMARLYDVIQPGQGHLPIQWNTKEAGVQVPGYNNQCNSTLSDYKDVTLKSKLCRPTIWCHRAKGESTGILLIIKNSLHTRPVSL